MRSLQRTKVALELSKDTVGSTTGGSIIIIQIKKKKKKLNVNHSDKNLYNTDKQAHNVKLPTT